LAGLNAGARNLHLAGDVHALAIDYEVQVRRSDDAILGQIGDQEILPADVQLAFGAAAAPRQVAVGFQLPVAGAPLAAKAQPGIFQVRDHSQLPHRQIDAIRIELAARQLDAAVELRQRQRPADRRIRREQACCMIDLREQQRQDIRVRGARAQVAGQRQAQDVVAAVALQPGVRI
jgi:hypothetical protein